MNKTLKILLIFLLFDAVVLGAYFGIKALGGKRSNPAADYEWTAMDESYQPQDSIEEFIKNDAAEKELFPVYIRNYKRNKAVLKLFRGTKFARASESVLNLSYPGLEDWMLIDIKYKNEKQQDIQRTILYVMIKNEWRVADSGRLQE